MSIQSYTRRAQRTFKRLLPSMAAKSQDRDSAMWRLVLAQNCIVKASGILHELPTGEISCFAIAPDGKRVYEKPADKISAGTFELPKYPCDGWILEKWFPPEVWGSRDEWKSHRSEDGSTIMGEYPSRGDYWMLAGPFERIPDLADLRQAIDMHRQTMATKPVDYANMLKQTILDQETAREQRRNKLEADLAYMRKNELVPVLKSGSLAAQRFRNKLNKSIGDRTHLGAVHNA